METMAQTFLMPNKRSGVGRRKSLVTSLSVIAWFALLRIREIAVAERYDPLKTICSKDVWPMKDGKMMETGFFKDWKEADAFTLRIPQSKTDKKKQGFLRELQRTGRELCPLRAMQHLIQWAPKEWDDAVTKGAQIPLHTSGSCKPIKGSEVDRMLKHVANTSGLASAKVSPHSLRAGGATAMYVNGLSRETIMKLGRWKSDAVLSSDT